MPGLCLDYALDYVWITCIMLGLYLDSAWITPGFSLGYGNLCLDYAWIIFGLCLDCVNYAWIMPELLLDDALIMLGVCLDYGCFMLGSWLDYPWTIL